MKIAQAILGLAGVLVIGGPVGAETWSRRVTPAKPDDNVTVKVERITETGVGEFLQFRVTVKLKDDNEMQRSHVLRVFHGNVFISSCEVQSTGPNGARVFSFRVAAKYAEKSTFTYTLSSEFGSIGYWFYLSDFATAK